MSQILKSIKFLKTDDKNIYFFWLFAAVYRWITLSGCDNRKDPNKRKDLIALIEFMVYNIL